MVEYPKINIIFENNHILVVEKPCNMPVCEDESNDLDLLTVLKKYIKDKYNKPGNVYLGMVHRLDRPVGGVMIFAKTSKAAKRLSKQINDGSFSKNYYAVVEGQLPLENFLEDYLYKDEKTRISYVTSKEKGKYSSLKYKIIKKIDSYNLVDVHLLSGRHHQIRVQFSSRGFPLVGDMKYGDGKIKCDIALFAYKLSILNPITKEKMEFEETKYDDEKKNDDGFHAMVICGYNDKHGHFIVRNSWGTAFGDNGYCYLPYSYIRDTDLTRYAVAITGINAKEFVRHNPVEEEYDFGSKNKNIQYAILLNMLKEDEHRLNKDRDRVKLLINELRKLIEEIKSKDDVDDLRESVDKKVQQLESNNLQLKRKVHQVSIWDNKVIHIVHICILLVSLIAIGFGVYYDRRYVWIVGTIVSVVDILINHLWYS